MQVRHRSRVLWALTTLGALLLPGGAHAQAFRVDFSRWTGPPLVKDKFGVYQTPFFFKGHPPASFDMTGLLEEAGVRDLRYEMGWGKPDTYAFDQISGGPADLRIDFSRLDPFVAQLERAGVTPLFAMTYDPLPLKTGTDWQRWKDVPSSLDAWRQINRRYAAHYRAMGLRAPSYEMWNEPDLPGDGGKVFFNGGPADYGRVFAAGAAGVHAGDPDALAGGPAVAWQAPYAQAILPDNPDFASIHGYADFPAQVGIMRGVVQGRPSLPIFLTEYASYSSFGLRKPDSRHEAAASFFRDVRGLLADMDVTKVYWAQWIDDNLGMLTEDLHRKALFNAYQIYQTMMPVDRNAVSPDGAGGVGLMASSDDHAAAVVAWNEGSAAKTVTLSLDRLPFRRGTVRLYRIDATHASYIDDKGAEALRVMRAWDTDTGAATWSGLVPAESVVFLRADDGTGVSLLRPVHIGDYMRSFPWFPDRGADSYADFDPRTAIARLGMGSRGQGVAQIGVLIAHPAPRWTAQVRRSGPFTPQDAGALFGLRIEYGSLHGGYSRSILWRDRASANPPAAPPWGRRGGPLTQRVAAALPTGQPFPIAVAHDAPPDWDHRILLTPILRDMGANSSARIILTPAP